MTTATPPRPPAAPPPAGPLTPADLYEMGDRGKGYELIDGQLRELNLSFRSSRVALRIGRLLDTYADTVSPGWVAGQEAGFTCFRDHPGRVRKPDVAFIAYGRMTPEQYAAGGYTGIVPDLVVEVVSENDLASAVEAKRIEWQRAGVREVWVVLPETSTVHAHRAGGPVTLGEGDTLTAPDVLPGFAVPVAELFRLPPAPAAA